MNLDYKTIFDQLNQAEIDYLAVKVSGYHDYC